MKNRQTFLCEFKKNIYLCEYFSWYSNILNVMSKEFKWNGFWHSTLAKVAGGVFVLVIIGVLVTCTGKGKPKISSDVDGEEYERNSEFDTLDVLGDYLFPNAPLQKDMTVTEDKTEAKDTKKTDAAGDDDGEILESADPTSAPAEEIIPITPVEVPKTAAPTIEKIEQ